MNRAAPRVRARCQDFGLAPRGWDLNQSPKSLQWLQGSPEPRTQGGWDGEKNLKTTNVGPPLQTGRGIQFAADLLLELGPRIPGLRCEPTHRWVGNDWAGSERATTRQNGTASRHSPEGRRWAVEGPPLAGLSTRCNVRGPRSPVGSLRVRTPF